VTDPLDITQTVLTRLVDLLRKLPAEQLAELYAGTATLEVVGKAGRPAKKVAAPVALPVSAEQVGGDLAKINDRAVATRYVNDLGLGVPQLRALAKELDIPIVILSQLSRAPESADRRSKIPQLSDLRESGAIEQDADIVLFIFREELYKPDDEDLKGKAQVVIAKHRNGPTGIVNLTFLKESTRFENFSAITDEYLR